MKADNTKTQQTVLLEKNENKTLQTLYKNRFAGQLSNEIKWSSNNKVYFYHAKQKKFKA